MREATGDLWTYHDRGEWVAVTTNGVIKTGGEAVMGRGVAAAAKYRYPELPKQLAVNLRKHGNRVFVFRNIRLITFPTKHDWRKPSDLKLIEQSCWQLMQALGKFNIEQLYMPRPGCGNGQLDWADVRPAVDVFFDGRIVVLQPPELLP